MHNRIDAVDRRKQEARRAERMARGMGVGSALVGAQFIPRRRRSVAVTKMMSHYSVGEDGNVTQTFLLGPGAGAFGSTLGFSETGGTNRG